MLSVAGRCGLLGKRHPVTSTLPRFSSSMIPLAFWFTTLLIRPKFYFPVCLKLHYPSGLLLRFLSCPQSCFSSGRNYQKDPLSHQSKSFQSSRSVCYSARRPKKVCARVCPHIIPSFSFICRSKYFAFFVKKHNYLPYIKARRLIYPQQLPSHHSYFGTFNRF